MLDKLKSGLKKENDIGQFERKNKLKKVHLQQYNQDINYSDVKFFNDCQQMLTNIANDARNQQKIIQHKRKMKILKSSQIQEDKVDQMLLSNIVIDFLRSHQMNYSYSMFLRQKNITCDQVVLKGQLESLLNLKQNYQKDSRLNVPILELIMKKNQILQKFICTKSQQSSQKSVQCQILGKNSQTNNVLLTELKLQEIRNEVEVRQKKHYENQMHLFRSKQLFKVKEDLSKLFQIKEAQVTQKYENKIKQLIKDKSQSYGSQSQTKRLQQYLHQIEKLKQQLRNIKQKNIKFEKQALTHECFKQQKVKNQLNRVSQQRKGLNAKKYQFQLALRNMDTKIEDLALQKQKIMSDGKKQTEQFLSKMKQHKQSKEYMIQKLYGTIRGFEQRIQNLSNDNIKILQQNQTLRLQLTGMKKAFQTSKTLQESKKKINLSDLKVPMKNILIGVTPQQLSADLQFDQQKSISETSSVFTYTTEQFDDKLRQKAEHQENINRLKLQMNLLKNKVKYLAMDFP